MTEKFVTATIKTLPTLPMKGIYYIGQYGTSGYASAARGYLYHYFTLGIPITWDPLYFDNSVMDDDSYNVVVKSLINKRLPMYDVVIMHSTPDLWPKFREEKRSMIDGKIVIGYCTWETNKLPVEWVRCINTTVNEVWVPSFYNERCFKESGVTVLIRVVPHIFLNKSLPPRNNIQFLTNGRVLSISNAFTFYTIGEFNTRKGIDDIIKAFCETFTNKDNVRLVLKVHYKDYTSKNKLKCESLIAEAIKPYENIPPIICLTENLTSTDILSLHSIGDCYISLTKAEGFGLTIFDAMHYGKRLIVTGYGGHMDFLGENHPGLVKYKLGSVKGMENVTYQEDQTWAYPDIEHAKQLMKAAIK